MDSSLGIASYKIYYVRGRAVQCEDFEQKFIDVSSLDVGQYILELELNCGKLSQYRIIKK